MRLWFNQGLLISDHSIICCTRSPVQLILYLISFGTFDIIIYQVFRRIIVEQEIRRGTLWIFCLPYHFGPLNHTWNANIDSRFLFIRRCLYITWSLIIVIRIAFDNCLVCIPLIIILARRKRPVILTNHYRLSNDVDAANYLTFSFSSVFTGVSQSALKRILQIIL